jgi:hypothetical protein
LSASFDLSCIVFDGAENFSGLVDQIDCPGAGLRR